MAHYEKRVKTASESNVETQVVALPPHVQNDVLGIIVACSDAGRDITCSGSWVREVHIKPSGSYRPTCAFFKLTAGATTEPDPTITISGGERVFANAFILRGVDTANLVDVSGYDNSISDFKPAMPQLTTTNDNALIFYICCASSGKANVQLPPVTQLDSYNIWFYATIGVINAGAAGLVPQHYCTHEEGDATPSQSCRFAIAFNSASGKVNPTVDPSCVPAEIIATLEDVDYCFGSEQEVDVSSTITQIENNNTTYRALSTADGPVWPAADTRVLNLYLNGPNASDDKVELGCLEFSSTQDLSNCLLSTYLWVKERPYALATVAQGGRYDGYMDSSGNWAIWKTEALDSKAFNADGGFPSVIDTSTTPFESSGTIDWTDINRRIFAVKHVSYGGAEWSMMYKITSSNTLRLIGGDTSRPLSLKNFADTYKGGKLLTLSNHRNFTDGQYFATQTIEIGNGSDPLYAVFKGESIAFPGAANVGDGNIQIYMPENTVGYLFHAPSGGYLDISSHTINLGNFHFFKFHANFANENIVKAEGCLVIGGTITLPNKSNVRLSGIVFTACKELVNQGFYMDGITFDACTESQAITITSEAEWNYLSGSTWTNNAIAIKITGNQSGTWQNNSLVFGGNTTDIEYTGNTNFSIQADSTPTFINSGSGVMSFVTPSPTVTVTVMTEGGTPIEGARVYIRESGGGSEILNTLTNSSGVATTSHTGSLPQSIEGWVRKATSGTLYKQFTLGGDITSSGYSTTAIMQED